MVRVPATALMPVDHGAQVALLGADNKVVLRPIQIGQDFGNSVEVKAGLTLQDRVIDSPPEILESGDAVQLVALGSTANPTKAGTQPAQSQGS